MKTYAENKERSCRAGIEDNQTKIVLPIAPQFFCRTRFDSEKIPARAVPPSGALRWIEENLQQGALFDTVVLEGPGDPLSDMDSTMETLRLVRRKHPKLSLSVTTLGQGAEKYAMPLAAIGTTSVTLLVDAVEPKVAETIYAWIRPDKKTVPLNQATALLMEMQSRAVGAFKAAGCQVAVRSTVYTGRNDDHIEKIALIMAECGADTMTLVPCRLVAGGEEQVLAPPDLKTMQRLQKKCSAHLKTFLQNKESSIGIGCPSLHGMCESISPLRPKPTKEKPNVAVVSLTGMEVDLHLGQANNSLIYGPREDGLTCLLGTRPLPDPGSGNSRWEELADSLEDCFAILTSSAGKNPRSILEKRGITVVITDGDIEGSVELLYGGGKKIKRCN